MYGPAELYSASWRAKYMVTDSEKELTLRFGLSRFGLSYMKRAQSA